MSGAIVSPFDLVVAKFNEKHKAGNGFNVKCPVTGHNDKKASLSIDKAYDGTVLLHCHAGCQPEDVVKALGLEMKDLFPAGNNGFKKNRSSKKVTLEDLATSKGLDPGKLTGYGVEQYGQVIRIKYFNMDGKPSARQRLRVALSGTDGSRWEKGSGSPVPYGIWRVNEFAEKHDYLVLVEGESDTWTLWHYGIPALGIPGASMANKLKAAYIDRFKKIYIWKEPDHGGDTFINGISNQLTTLKYGGQAFIIHGHDGVKDPNELHKKYPGEFLQQWNNVVFRARSVELKEKASDQAPAPMKDKQFFIDGTFVPPLLGDYLMALYHFMYAGQTLYLYEDGVYKPSGAESVRKESSNLLKWEFRKRRVEETIYYIETKTMFPLDELNKYIGLINVKNGLLEWRTGKLLPHDPNYKCTVQLPVHYDPEATCPETDKFWGEIVPADCLPLLEEFIGYCMVPSTQLEKSFMLTGAGANGKSTFLNQLTCLIGKGNVSNVPLQELVEHRFKRAELLGKLVNIFADLESVMLKSSSYFKMITSGDQIDAERKYKDPFFFKPFARLVYSANEIPRSADKSQAYYRRWIIIPFPNSFMGHAADKNLITRLATDKELSGLLNRALAGLQRLVANHAFTEPKSTMAALETYKINNDSVASFTKECCGIQPEFKVLKNHLYKTYEAWCEENGMRKVSSIKFNQRLQEVCPTIIENRVDTGRGYNRFWLGIGLPAD